MSTAHRASLALPADNGLSPQRSDRVAGPAQQVQGAAPTRALLGVIVLTHNSATVLERTLRAALQLVDRVHVVDSGSSDGTLDLLAQMGCVGVHRAFNGYSEQRNWAIDQFGALSEWQLHLDADELLDEQAIAAIRQALAAPGSHSGFIFERRTYFMGRMLRFGGTTNYHLRLFRTGTARCEDRLYDQHFVSLLPAKRLGGLIHDLGGSALSEWTARHNRWSDLETAELLRQRAAGDGQIRARISADPRERRRLYKGGYYWAPPIWRALALFVYRYVFQAGFLDGKAGFLYAILQTLWFRMLVDAKLLEKQQERA